MAIQPNDQGAYSQVKEGSFAQTGEFFTGVYNGKELPVDPYITGYAFIKWLTLPQWVEEKFPGFRHMTEKNLRAFTGMDDIEIATISVQGGFTPSEIMFPGTITMPNGFQMTHNDFSGSPVANAYTYWATGIRDPETGIATHPGAHRAANYTGSLLYIVTKPNANPHQDNGEGESIIEKAAYYTAVWPMKLALTQYNFTAGTNESPQVEMSLAGQRHIGEQIDKAAANELSKIHNFVTANEYTVAGGGEGGGDAG